MWYEKEGNNMDVVLSTKIVLNRNIKGFPFPPKMSDADRENVLGMARQAAGTMGLNFVRTDELEDNAKEDLYNQFYAGYAFLNSNAKTGYLMSKTEGLGVIINNTDHISIVSMVPGTDVVTAYKRADDLAVQFEKSMDIAYTDKFGFLTSQIKSVGTGMQLMMTLALPGIEKTEGAVQVLAKRVEKYDWQMIPMTHSDGIRENGIYVLTNVATLGITEQEIIDKTRKVQEDIIKLENSCRKNICTKKKGVVEDQYYRAYATLSYCRRIDILDKPLDPVIGLNDHLVVDALKDKGFNNAVDPAFSFFCNIEILRSDNNVNKICNAFRELGEQRIDAFESNAARKNYFLILLHCSGNDVGFTDEVCDICILGFVIDIDGCADLLDDTVLHDDDRI